MMRSIISVGLDMVQQDNKGRFVKGIVPWNKGKKASQESKLKMSLAAKDRIKRNGHCWLGRKHSSKSIEKMRFARLGKKLSRKLRQKLGEAHKKFKIKKQDLFKLYWVEKLNGVEIAKKFSIHPCTVYYTMKHFNIPLRNRSEISPLNHIKEHPWVSERNKRPEIIQHVLNAVRKRPTKLEQKLIEIVNSHNLPFKYVGDGTVIIDGKCPDFINPKASQIIEVFGKHWHSPEDEYKRTQFFNHHGYKCLVLWEDEFKNEITIVSKIKGFLSSEV